MADENKGGTPNNADILSQLLRGNVVSQQKQERLLESIDKNLSDLLRNSNKVSISNAASVDSNKKHSAFSNSVFNDRYKTKKSEDSINVGSMSDFFDSFEKQLRDGFLGSDFKAQIKGAFDTLASDMGVETKDITKTIGKVLGSKAVSFIANITDDGLGNNLISTLQESRKHIFDAFSNSYNSYLDTWYDTKGADLGLKRQQRNPATEAANAVQSSPDKERIVGNTSLNSLFKDFNSINSDNITVYAENISIQQAESLAERFMNDSENQDPFELLSDFETFKISANNISIYAQTVGVNELNKMPEDIGKSVSEMASSVITAQTEPSAVPAPEDVSKASESASNSPSIGDAVSAASTAIDVAKLAGIEDIAAADAALTGVVTVISEWLGGFAAAVGITVTELLGIAGLVVVAVGAVVVAFDLLKKALKNALQPAVDGTEKAFEKAKEAANRYATSQKKNLESAQKRLKDDVKTMVEAPFKIMEDAANKWYQTWDENLRTINGTQGYNKDELQSLMGAFADRLREENLTDVISAADISDNLAKVLESGLSGTVAEEFAYLATKLNAAIPTQDFFEYASTYSSIAANAIRNGKSQNEAISLANAQLELFASNVLYAGRELAGGFTTGLKDAQSIFEQSVQIAQTAKTDNANEIAGVMTAVSAITGAIAPDLATSMTDAIYKAAVGGNSSEIVALRSLAGINASNTEFLKQLSDNPKKVFVDLFTELSKRQNMSPDAYMEVAEGLSEIFGVSIDAFARVDFAYLAQAIESMNTSNDALADNFELLAAGETTTNDEMLKMQQINKYMLDEGLAYVLDNQAARAIQEHMWQEQIARDIMEATYGVELQGAALEFLEGIRQTVDNILGFLNPFKLLGKLANLGASIVEASALKADIAGLLEAGKVGTGKAESKYQLTTRNRDLNLTDNIVNMLGGTSWYAAASGLRKVNNVLANPFTYGSRFSDDISSYLSAGINTIGFSKFTGESSYNWNTIGKSIAKQIAATPQRIPSGTSVASASATQLSMLNNPAESNTEKAQQQANNKVKTALDSMTDFVQNDTEHTMTYDDWKKFAANKYFKGGNFDSALEGAGMSEEAVKGQFDMLQTQVAGKEKLEREKREERFWENNTKLLTTTTDWLESINTHTENLFKKFEDYYSEWTKYFIDHRVYNSAFTHEDYDRVARQEKEGSETAIYALADALTQNKVELLLDPTLQTNALLAQILKVAAAILNQTKDSGTALSLADTIAGLSLGIVNV